MISVDSHDDFPYPIKQVTISMGVAVEVSNRYSSFATLIAMADKALYQAKREGRNQIKNVVEIEEKKTDAEES